MNSYVDQVKNEIESLLDEGNELQKLLIPPDDESKIRLRSIRNLVFVRRYQMWYTKALNVVKVFVPERLDEFESYHRNPKRGKGIDYATYTLSDFAISLEIKRGNAPLFDIGQAALSKFTQQYLIVRSVEGKLDSIIGNLRAILQADLFDSDLGAANELIKNGHVRAAGALAGVVLEKHLQTVCENHQLSTRKKAPGISDYNQMLKEAEVLDVPNWRFIQRLADIRNLCSHAKDRDPTSDEVEELIAGVDKIIKTLF